LGPQAAAKFSSCIKNFRLGGQKNRTGIGPHPPHSPACGKPVLSSDEVGYVRRSEVDANIARAMDFVADLPKALTRRRMNNRQDLIDRPIKPAVVLDCCKGRSPEGWPLKSGQP
jgi:hypothetical protein